MSRRVEEKRERQSRQIDRSKMMQTIIFSTIICAMLVILIVSFLVPKLILTVSQLPNVSIAFSEVIFFIHSPITYFMLFLGGIGLTSALNAFHIFISIILILFFIFLYVAVGNIREYQRAVAGWFELIATFIVVIILSLLFFDLVPDKFFNVTVFVLTLAGCFIFSIYLYFTQ
ncbi:MAG: hypothetical protein ACTSRW_14185 [Candidatus Helarchaeota archaeon]